MNAPSRNAETDAPAYHISRKLIVGLLLIGGLSVLLHGLNLRMVIHHAAETGLDFTIGPDTPTYLSHAAKLKDGGHLNPMYQERLLVPLLLRLGDACGLGPQSFLWVVVLFEMLGVFAIGCFVHLLTKRSWLALAAAFLFALYPGTYKYGVLIETDVIHVHLTMAAVTALVFMLKRPCHGSYIAAGILWPLVHLTRPTLFGMAGLMPIFLWRGLLERSSRGWCIGVCVMTALVPLSWTISNAVRFGVPSPSLCQAEMLNTWTLPRLKAIIQNEQEPGRISVMFREEVQRVRQQESWRKLHGVGPTLDGFKSNYLAVLGDAKTFLRQNVRILATSVWWELWHQSQASQTYYHTYINNGEDLAVLYPPWFERSRAILKVGAILGVLGLASVLSGKSRSVALLFLVIMGLVFLPAGFSCYAGARYRMLTDLLMIPFVAVAATQGLAWCALAVIVAVGYLPHRMLGWPGWYFWAILLSTLSVFSLRLFLACSRQADGLRPSSGQDES